MNKNEFNKEWQELTDADEAEKAACFSKYCTEIVNKVGSKGLTEQDAGYEICGALATDGIENIPGASEVLTLACDLELPAAHRDATNKVDAKVLDRLKKLIKAIH